MMDRHAAPNYAALPASGLDNGDIKNLITVAIKHSGVTSLPTRPALMVIQSESKKRKPGRIGQA